jgi:hypothetical protein
LYACNVHKCMKRLCYPMSFFEVLATQSKLVSWPFSVWNDHTAIAAPYKRFQDRYRVGVWKRVDTPTR